MYKLSTFYFPADVQMDENRESGRVSLGLSVVVRVTLRDGVYHEVWIHLLLLTVVGSRIWFYRECQV